MLVLELVMLLTFHSAVLGNYRFWSRKGDVLQTNPSIKRNY